MKITDILSRKQIQSYQESDARINIWEGAVRSGKTFVSLIRFIKELKVGPEGEYVIICRTYDTFKRNILPQLGDLIGKDLKHFSGKREIHLYGKIIHIVGADDESAEAKVRGPTFVGAYVDEATIIPQSVFKQLIARCAMHGAKIFTTTNPDSPFHWLKRDFLENNPDVKSWQFTMDDNPQLTDEDKRYLRTQYRGLWYQRFIEGKWVQAEGAIYDFFDKEHHVIDQAPPIAKSYVVGVDYGTTNPCAFILMGINRNNLGFWYWVEDEYYYDSKVHQRQKTDSEYALDLMRFIKDRGVEAIYIDPSAASFKVECQRQGIRNIFEAENEVLDGIRKVGDLLNNGTLKICSKAKHLINEFTAYVWDSKSLLKGVDKPLKANDHCFCASTPVQTARGEVAIEKISRGDFVLTRGGLRKVLETWNKKADLYEYNICGLSFSCTNSHKFFTLNRGFIEISNVIKSDVFVVNIEDLCEKKLNGGGRFIGDIPALKHLLTEITTEGGKGDLAVDISIEKFGSHIMGRFHPDTIFITRTGIPLTTTLAIWNFSVIEHIAPIMGKILQKSRDGYFDIMQNLLDQSPLAGTLLKRDTNGIKSTERILENSLLEYSNARNVEKSIKLKRPLELDFVRINVSLDREEVFSLIMRLSTVKDALFPILDANIVGASFAPESVQRGFIGNKDVYNLTVEGEHEFYANGLLVANCLDALRYAVYTKLFAKDNQGMTPQQYERMKNEALGVYGELPDPFRNPTDYGPSPMPWR